MLSLRHKLLVGFGGLLLIMALIGIRGIMQVSDLRGAIQAIMSENYRSVVACQDMKEAIERIDDGALFLLLGYRQDGIDPSTGMSRISKRPWLSRCIR